MIRRPPARLPAPVRAQLVELIANMLVRSVKRRLRAQAQGVGETQVTSDPPRPAVPRRAEAGNGP